MATLPITVLQPFSVPHEDREDNLLTVIGDLEELWSEGEEWPVDKAAGICPVFRTISGKPLR